MAAVTASGELVSDAASSGKAAIRTPSPKAARNADSQYRVYGPRSPPAVLTESRSRTAGRLVE